jgi:hypothetical protein
MWNEHLPFPGIDVVIILAPNFRLKTTILSPRVTTVQRGSILNLLCVVSEHDKPPHRIAWVINGTILDFQVSIPIKYHERNLQWK